MMPQASLALIAAMKAAEAKAEEEDSLTVYFFAIKFRLKLLKKYSESRPNG
jgi:hypothetical protein